MKQPILFLLGVLLCGCAEAPQAFYPAPGAREVAPDTRLTIHFRSEPAVGAGGMIRIWDAETDTPVDSLDLSIPAGPAEPTKLPKPDYTPVPYDYDQPRHTNATIRPGTPSGAAGPTSDRYQLTIIGGFTDAFHFHPVIVHGTKAEIYPHHNLLTYGRTYYVTIDDGVLTTPENDFHGIDKSDGWRFSTRASAPVGRRLVVSADGTGDFHTVQGALDFIPDHSDEPWTVFVRNGDYEELVYSRNKSNVTIEGESREGVYIHYPNNEVFNPHPDDVATNEWPGTFPSRRAAFMADNCTDVTFRNLTIATTLTGQAEGLLLMGERYVLEHVTVRGSGDALQANGPVYLFDCLIEGHGDTILGRGPAFFDRCTLISRGPFMWIRNTEANHGNVFVDCTLRGVGDGAVIARTNGRYPHCEAVLLRCRLENIRPEGWHGLEHGTFDVHYWEYDSRNLADGTPVEVSQRAKGSRQLTAERDSLTIRNYSDPAWVLGWDPKR